MAFSDYKNIAQVQEEFGIKYQEENFIVAQDIEPPAPFRGEYDFNRENIDVFTSKASPHRLGYYADPERSVQAIP